MDYKIKCEELRKIRVKVESDLGLTDIVRKTPCTFVGECIGTCPACEAEERALMDEIYKISQNGELIRKQKPEFIPSNIPQFPRTPVPPSKPISSDTGWERPNSPDIPRKPEWPMYPLTGMPAPPVQGQILQPPYQGKMEEKNNSEKKGLFKKLFAKGK